MTKPLSPAAQAVLDAYANSILSDPHGYKIESVIAAALRAAADHVNHDWSAFNCIDALYEIAAELEANQ